MTEREALKRIAGFTLSQFMGPHDMALECVNVARDALTQPEQEPVAWRDHIEQRLLTWRQSFVNKSGDQLALDDFMDKQSLDDLIDFVCDEYTTPSVPTSDTSEKRVDEMAKQRHEPEPVIDKSAAVRIATSLGWTPQRKPLTDEEIEDLYFDKFSMGELNAFARAIEAAHGIWPENSDCHGPDWTDRDGEYLK